jgi:vacuolar-type H+-ATPase catalytic subunit A/Vma1
MATKPNTHESMHSFIRRNNIDAKLVHKQVYQNPVMYNDFDSYKDGMNYYINYETVPALEMTVPLSVMEDLVETHDEVERLKQFFGPYALSDMKQAYLIIQSSNHEEFARRNNPAVKKAWENYQLLLKIAGG